MAMSPSPPRRRYELTVLAILLLIVGGITSTMSGHSPVVLLLGLLMIVISVPLVRHSNFNPLMTTGPARSAGRRRTGALAWAWGLLSLLALCFSLYLLHSDALEGKHQLGPWTVAHAVLFAAAIVVLSWANALGSRH